MRVGDVGYQPVHGPGWDYQHYQVIDLDTGNVVWVDCKAGVFTIDGVPPQASTQTETPTESNTDQTETPTESNTEISTLRDFLNRRRVGLQVA